MSHFSFRPLDSLNEVESQRAAWHESLTELPELFVEMAVRRSSAWVMTDSDVQIGYFTAEDQTLTQLYLTESHRTHSDVVLDQISAKFGLKQAWVSTFDPLVLVACTSKARRYSVMGCHFRRQRDISLAPPSLTPAERIATSSDIARIAAINDPEVFDDPDDIPIWVESGFVTLFEADADLVGFGLCTPTGPLTRGADIGGLVSPPYQRQGLGVWIARRMAARCRAQGLIPTGGCAMDNLASRRTLERAGFVADHRLLVFELD